MSIAAANTFTRNIYKEWIKPDATPQQEAKVSKIASLVVKAFALVFVLLLDKQNAINFQLLGGIWILQTFPAVVLGLYTRWLHRWALLAGWAVGMVYGTWQAWNVANPRSGVNHFGGSLAEMPVIGQLGYIALTAFVINLLVAVVLTFVFRATKTPGGEDETIRGDYFADAGDPRRSTAPSSSRSTRRRPTRDGLLARQAPRGDDGGRAVPVAPGPVDHGAALLERHGRRGLRAVSLLRRRPALRRWNLWGYIDGRDGAQAVIRPSRSPNRSSTASSSPRPTP